MTSHSRQGQTADLVLIHDDTELEAKTRSRTEWPASPSQAAHTPPAFPAQQPPKNLKGRCSDPNPYTVQSRGVSTDQSDKFRGNLAVNG